MHHFSGCSELFLNSERSLHVQSSLQKNQLSTTHRFDIAKCILNHTDLTVKSLSTFVISIVELGSNKHHFFTPFSNTLTCAQSCLTYWTSQPWGKNIYESYLVHKFWSKLGIGGAKHQTLMRLGFGLGCRGVVWGDCFKQNFFTSFSVVVVFHLSFHFFTFVSTALITK